MGRKILAPILPEAMDCTLENAEVLHDKKSQEEAVRTALIKNLHGRPV